MLQKLNHLWIMKTKIMKTLRSRLRGVVEKAAKKFEDFFCYEVSYYLKILTVLVLLNTLRQVVEKALEYSCFKPRPGVGSANEVYRCSLIKTAIFDGPDQYNNCVETVGSNTCAYCTGSSCINQTVIQDTGAILSQNLTFLLGDVYHFTKCATVPLSYPDYVYNCFTTEDKQLTFSQVSHLVSSIFKCNTSTASQTCTLSLDDTYTSFKIMGAIFGVVTVGIFLYSITVVNNLVNLLWTMDLFAAVYCNPFRNRPFKIKRYQILCDCQALPPPATTTAPPGDNSGMTAGKVTTTRDMYFFENAHNRIHVNYCSDEILSYYNLNKHSGRQEEGRIEGMTVECKEFLLQLLLDCEQDASKWPVETSNSGHEDSDFFSHYMSLKDLIHQSCEMEHPHVHEKEFHDERYILGNYHLYRFLQQCVNWLISLTQRSPKSLEKVTT